MQLRLRQNRISRLSFIKVDKLLLYSVDILWWIFCFQGWHISWSSCYKTADKSIPLKLHVYLISLKITCSGFEPYVILGDLKWQLYQQSIFDKFALRIPGEK